VTDRTNPKLCAYGVRPVCHLVVLSVTLLSCHLVVCHLVVHPSAAYTSDRFVRELSPASGRTERRTSCSGSWTVTISNLWATQRREHAESALFANLCPNRLVRHRPQA